MKILVLLSDGCNYDYSQFNHCCRSLTLCFKGLKSYLTESFSYDMVFIDESFLVGLKDFKEIEKVCSISHCFFFLNQDTSGNIEELFELGAKDVFVKPLSVKEVSTKIKRRLGPECLELLKLSRYGATLKQVQIHQILKSKGPAGAEREEFLEHIWNTTNVIPRNVDVQIWSLKKILRKHKIGDIKNRNNRWYLVG